jgi:hypothetical protein
MGVGEGVGIASLWGWAADILGIPELLKFHQPWSWKVVARLCCARPSHHAVSHGASKRCQAALGCASRPWRKKRHQQGPAGATSSPPKTQSLLVTTWRVLQSSYKLATDSWGLSSVIGFPAAICWQTDPMPSQTADSSSYSCAALAQTRNNVKRTDGQTVLRRLFKPFLGIILVYFTNKLQWDIPSFK